ncbi:type II secretion system protein GspL [Legionella longbeachae]|uniref:Type II secretion system protein L n=1 Tax=Legionella longbeachae serogroup 1 (strain NSW150) TaxID=661367 RepID=D3HRV4_LEGLN|nr:type II secretion system protein GspL [Legionella longbeachae]VEE02137.1 general secretion pathway protein L [Legionella oakridgensis]HBD7396618.1 general secretion pathway protein GspL [Legionella pneumophila]ARB91563.1 general secretion pathway protein GspL [Legionella longbeachae]ARM35291.1 general secretion pathway protein GspL [Legionella longbeachae]EEZ95239.1 type II secretory pathway protein LspL [Legionella longbeachae D-4968]
MDTFFLFTKHLDENGCFCLKINADGTLIVPPAKRDFIEIKTLQNDCKTLVIETSEQASLFNLELSWLPERKARAAIPYALEDKLAQPVDELHFAFDRARYQNNQYLITVVSKQRIRYLMQLLHEHDIEFVGITLDWFALEPKELCFNEATLLINTDEFKGALKEELVDIYLKNHPDQQPLLFTDSPSAYSSLPQKQEDSSVWIAQRLLKAKLMNLCQGEMQHGDKTDLLKKKYLLTAALFCLWLISLLSVNAIQLHSLNKQTQKIDDQIAVIYHEFFPDAKQIISPKFRITQLLKNNNAEDQNRFWFLLNQFAKVMKNDRITLEQLRFQNKTLSVTLISTDFASLEELENELKKLQLKVKQTQASTHEQQVVATLELS